MNQPTWLPWIGFSAIQGPAGSSQTLIQNNNAAGQIASLGGTFKFLKTGIIDNAKSQIKSINLSGNDGKDYEISGLTAIKLSAYNQYITNNNSTGLIKEIFKGKDVLTGSDDNDSLCGYSGDDVLAAGAGADCLFGGTGKNTLTGGAGADYFGFDARVDLKKIPTSKQVSIITDFDASGGDKIEAVSTHYTYNSGLTASKVTTFSGAKGEFTTIKVGNDLLFALDIDGSKKPEFLVLLQNINELSASSVVFSPAIHDGGFNYANQVFA